MKINSVVSYNFSGVRFKKPFGNENNNQALNFSTQNDTFTCSSNPISFGSKGSQLFFSAVRNIPCPCCGKIMISKSDFNSIAEEAFSETSQKAVKVISQYKEHMNGIEKLCYDKIEEISKTQPQNNLQKILMGLRPESLKKLRTSEFKILGEMDNLGRDLSFDSLIELSNLTNEARNLISKDTPDNPFKRKSFIYSVSQFKEKIPEKEIAEEIYKKASSLTNSDNDVNSFIVKYSQRSSREIGQRLISRAAATIEHIKPRANEGTNSAENYLLECMGCNNDRGNIPLDEWVRTHPSMPKNSQKYIDFVIKKINLGLLKDFDWYPSAIAKTLKAESKELINLDISELKTGHWTSNRNRFGGRSSYNPA